MSKISSFDLFIQSLNKKPVHVPASTVYSSVYSSVCSSTSVATSVATIYPTLDPFENTDIVGCYVDKIRALISEYESMHRSGDVGVIDTIYLNNASRIRISELVTQHPYEHYHLTFTDTKITVIWSYV